MESGSLHIITGCMYSGKTTKLNQMLHEYTLKGYKTTLFSHKDTDRERNRNSSFPQLTPEYIPELNKYTIIDRQIKVIGVDETQFFNQNIISFVETQLFEYNRIIILSGLDGTYEGKPFGFIRDLYQHATIEKLYARCDLCQDEGTNNPALYSARISNDKDLVVTGDEKYMPMCLYHYVKQKD
jgi:thymidine kinase